MSRRSLRLDDGLLDRSLPHSSASFSVGGASWRSARSLRSRHSQQHSVSCSESLLLLTPGKPSLLNSSVASDASLLSSLLEESSVQETTLVDSFWGLDQDVDPKESTIIAEQSTVLAERTLIGSDGRCPKHLVQTLSRVYCQDCEDRKESINKYCPFSVPRTPPAQPGDTETPTIYCRDRRRKRETAPSSHRGVMNLKESTSSQKELHPNRPLCKTAGDLCTWLSRRWRHMTTSFLPSRFPLRLLLVLLPLLLLLFSLCCFGPAVLQSVLPAVDIAEGTATPDVPALSSVHSITPSQSQSAEGAAEASREVQPYEEPVYSRPPPAEAQTGEELRVSVESGRLVRLEESLAALWERLEAGGRQAEQRHSEVLRLYTDLQQQQLVSAQGGGGGGGVEAWLSGLLDQQLEQLRSQLDEERLQREQTRQQDLLQQQTQTSRLDQLELRLQALADKTEEEQQRREAATPTTLPAAVSVGVDRQSHDALLAEVARLEAALEGVRRDVEGLSRCWDGLRRLEGIQQTISAQVSTQLREEVRTLVYGNQLTVRDGASGDGAGLPESLLQWLSQQYVSEADLQVALASLELSILQNISLQLEQHRSEQTVREAVQHAAGAAGAAGAAVTQEDVHVIVKNALRLFSQDRTGLADYALESGGGSILSTRCSETYETKAALLSLFGVPLWYFSQSPRVVIQPDIHPGNCWAFKGSAGFLVIRLSMRILPTAFSLEHIPKVLAPSGTLLSAPRNFSVYGLDDESQEGGKLLGTYSYDEDGEALQTFAVSEESDRAFQIIEVQVLSNWGHQEYTCMYRFRVHGTPADV